VHAALRALIDKVDGVAEGRPLELGDEPGDAGEPAGGDE
jgi:hypothetical protein